LRERARFRLADIDNYRWLRAVFFLVVCILCSGPASSVFEATSLVCSTLSLSPSLSHSHTHTHAPSLFPPSACSPKLLPHTVRRKLFPTSPSITSPFESSTSNMIAFGPRASSRPFVMRIDSCFALLERVRMALLP
jgi:hypothetical protein